MGLGHRRIVESFYQIKCYNGVWVVRLAGLWPEVKRHTSESCNTYCMTLDSVTLVVRHIGFYKRNLILRVSYMNCVQNRYDPYNVTPYVYRTTHFWQDHWNQSNLWNPTCPTTLLCKYLCKVDPCEWSMLKYPEGTLLDDIWGVGCLNGGVCIGDLYFLQ